MLSWLGSVAGCVSELPVCGTNEHAQSRMSTNLADFRFLVRKESWLVTNTNSGDRRLLQTITHIN